MCGEDGEKFTDERGGLFLGGEAVVHPAALLAGADEAGVAEDRHVAGDCGGGELEEFDDLAGADLALAAGPEGADAALVAECGGDGCDLEQGRAPFRYLTN
jgi:hypothetical protein